MIQQKNISQSIALFDKAKNYIPGGVNSPVRAFKSVGGTPLFIKKAAGAYLFDVDENTYIDYINSWGPMILGHCHPDVVFAMASKAAEAISLGAPSQEEVDMAELVTSIAPNVDLIRLVSSGTEACMSALRLARGYTGRNKFIKFEGCYHGHADPFLVKAGSGVATFSIQAVPGVTEATAQDTLTCPYNNLEQFDALMDANKGEIAAVIVEPVAGNMGCILPKPGFLEGLRAKCDEHGAVLIFDEVMTGFRLALGGVQERLGVDADLVTYGKVIGGGMPVGAFGGKEEIMNHISPVGKVYQAGTLSGNPVAVAAGYTTLSILKSNPAIYDKLENQAQTLKNGLHEALSAKGMPFVINQLGSMISVHFSEQEVVDFETASSCDISMFNQFFHHMLNEGIYLPPSAYESWFMSNALTSEDIEQTVEAVRKFAP